MESYISCKLQQSGEQRVYNLCWASVCLKRREKAFLAANNRKRWYKVIFLSAGSYCITMGNLLHNLSAMPKSTSDLDCLYAVSLFSVRLSFPYTETLA